jgi:HK97 gp10 family phage protein
VRIDVDLSELNALIKDLGEGVEQAIRPAAQAGAQVIYDAVKLNVGKIRTNTGNLASAIYQAYDKRASTNDFAAYGISWNPAKAPHGHWLEFGHIQRYQSYVGKDGKFHTLVRPEMRGKPKPGRRAPQAVKDAYYMPRKGGAVQVAAQPFMRPAFAQLDKAAAAVEQEFFKRINAI